MKPRLRGWLHVGAAPTAAIAGIILTILTPAKLRIPVAIYALSTVVLFTISATYHRVNWRPPVRVWMQRVDHSAIFVLIAGSYTAVTATLVTGHLGTMITWGAWIAATIGILGRLLWTKAPRWIFVPAYVIFGVAAAMFAPSILENGGPVVLSLIIAGGVCYLVGALIFATQYPNPSPRWFGFHEVFHSFTLGGYATHFIAIAIAVFSGAALSN